ncbi:MAG: MAPEG family protein [Steroidobacteraceae bacterium]
MTIDPIWLPTAGMVFVTALVWIKLYADRLGEMRDKRISPQSLATARAAAGRLENTWAADNFRNLFEVPVLFYVLCIALAVTGGSTPGFVAAAWAYVILRALHSLIHVTYNRVMHRFLVYAASTVLLFGMWIAFVVGKLP